MKCIVTPRFPPQIENEANGLILRVDAIVITAQQISGPLNVDVTIPIPSTLNQVVAAIKTRVQSEFLRLLGVTIQTSDIVVVGISIA